MAELANSTYLDLTSYRGNGTLPTGSPLTSAFSFNIALVLERANNNDPTSLLSGSWAERQAALADQTAVFQTYGADPADHTAVLNELARLGIQTVDQFDPTNGYVSSVESRTIWVHVDNTNYTTLFGSTRSCTTAARIPSAIGLLSGRATSACPTPSSTPASTVCGSTPVPWRHRSSPTIPPS